MIVSFINLKGGCGKTTSCIACATAAVNAGKSVRVYDTDPQSSATDWSIKADEAGTPLPFDVDSANKAIVKSRIAKLTGDPNRWIFIDCPPSGDVVDDVKNVSDFIVVPTTTSPADMSKAVSTAETLAENGYAYAILLTRVKTNTLGFRDAMDELTDQDLSFFETRIPDREAVRRLFGKQIAERDMNGYKEVFEEIEGAL